MTRRVFVTGTDTGIGKTVVSACLVRAWRARYWKPVQTGLATEAGDTAAVIRLAGIAAEQCHPPRHALQAPLSPEAAARREQVSISLEDFTLPPGDEPLVVEGAGGLLVPLNGAAMMIDLIARLGLPAILVARASLGTLNHTLLSLLALRRSGIEVGGVVLVGAADGDNAGDIAHHGEVRILSQLPAVPAVTPDTVAIWSGRFG